MNNMFKLASGESKKEAQLFNRYEDPTGEFTNRDLKFSEWYLRHKVWLRHVLIGFLIAIIVVFGGYGLYGIFEYAFYGYGHDERVRTELAQNAVALKAIQKSIVAEPIVFAKISYFSAGENKVDFLAMATNPNERWAAEIYYTFASGDQETVVMSTWVWPNKTNALAVFAADQIIANEQTRLVVKKINWRRLDNRTYLNPEQFLADRLDWKVTDFVFVPVSTVPGAAYSQVKFKLINQSAFGYWQSPFVALFKKGDTVVGIRSFVLDSWLVQDGAKVELTVKDENVDIDSVEVFANLNLFDNNNYQLIL